MATKPFTGKDTKAEEKAEARSVRSGRTTPSQYVRKEKAEEKKEGERKPVSKLQSTGRALASGRMSPEQYARGMKSGGMVKGGKC